MKIKTIGVLTSGGDAPGMNAAIRAVARAGISKGIKVLGIRHGYKGLITGDIFEMNLRTVSDIMQCGGTILYSARCPEFKTEEGMNKAVETCKEYGIDGIVVIGGDGSFRGAHDLTIHGVPCIGIPATIDNDIGCSDYSIGFDTALNTIMGIIDKIRDTAQSHDHCNVVEVMGRNCGNLALHAGIACGAVSVLVPEIPYDYQKDIIERMQRTQKVGKKHFIIIVAEGVGGSAELVKRIHEETGIQTRNNVLGHVQRGGSPTAKDRVIASNMGHYAVDLLLEGKAGRVIVKQKADILDYDIIEALNMKKTFDKDLYEMNLELSI